MFCLIDQKWLLFEHYYIRSFRCKYNKTDFMCIQPHFYHGRQVDSLKSWRSQALFLGNWALGAMKSNHMNNHPSLESNSGYVNALPLRNHGVYNPSCWTLSEVASQITFCIRSYKSGPWQRIQLLRFHHIWANCQALRWSSLLIIPYKSKQMSNSEFIPSLDPHHGQ